ncbi:LysR family transcriptional regulator [Lachnobacterium bovis]|uniref:DNA-binding transcriptional regulator, LysR family n=1 Tax=Lachnobacterium bovis TaxID=140626 RepID=A0A1H9T667_9FIRM|nr:LysR family transcriptional regulator [Lachnobacterium bovis]SER92735.1 DNA-binding transcriptional regulator, LysR family [Lachnobacterium bovis]
MNTKNFKCFQVVYEEKNLSLAAKKLFLTPQGLGKIIRNLEEEFGATFFIRTKEGFVATESGHLFYKKIKDINKELNELMIEVEHLEKKEKRFKVGFAAGTIKSINIDRLEKFMLHNNEIERSWIECENDLVKAKILNGDISFGFTIGKPKEKNLKSFLIDSKEVMLYVYKGHRLWDRESVDLNEIKNESIITMNEKHHIYHDLIDACNVYDFSPNIVALTTEGESIYRLIKNRIGIGISPNFYPDSEEIRGIHINGDYTWDIYGVYREDTADKEIAEKLVECF